MIKVLIWGFACAGLVGCASPSVDLLNNNFTNIMPSSSPLKGNWSGSNGPYLVTYKFNEDGTGLVCSSYNDKNTVEKIKIADNTMYMQNGLKQIIVKSNENELVLKALYFGSAIFKYKPDPKLVNASPYCEKNLE